VKPNRAGVVAVKPKAAGTQRHIVMNVVRVQMPATGFVVPVEVD
jgi:hypothetical protein